MEFYYFNFILICKLIHQLIRALTEHRLPPELIWIPKFKGDFLVQKTHLWKKFHEDMISFLRDRSQIVEKASSCSVEESFKKFQDPYPNVDDFRKLMVSSLSSLYFR